MSKRGGNGERIYTSFKVVCVLAMLVSLFLIYEHFSESAEKVCPFGKSFDCGIVNKSPYSSVDGFLYFLLFDVGVNVRLLNLSQYGLIIEFLTTNAFLGFLTFLYLLLSIIHIKKKKKFFGMDAEKQLKTAKLILWLSLVYALYLVYIEFFVLKTICVFCVVLEILIVTGLILVYRLRRVVL